MKKTLRLIFLTQLLSGLLPCALGQIPDKVSQRDLWRTRADVLTGALLKDSSKKDTLDHALITAKLGDLWWETDQVRANAWIEKSVDAICFYSPDKSKGESDKFFRVARQVLALVSNHNKKQAIRLSQVLSESENGTDSDKKQNAEALVEEALRIVKENPKGAADLGVEALYLGFPSKAAALSWALRRYNPELANQFFRAAFATLAASPDRSKLYVMEPIAFPENLSAEFPVNLRPPPDLRLSFLNFVADYLNQLQLKFSSGAIPSCAGEAVFTMRLEKGFAEMLPKRADAVRQIINICVGNQSQQVRDLITKTSTSSDVDELLEEADQLQDNSGLRANYLFKAALAATQQKKFLRSIEILNRMNDEERKANMDLWQELRWEAGAGLAVARFKEGDSAGANQTLKEIPEELRAIGQITFVLQFSGNDVTSYQVCVELLNDSRRGIIKSDLPFARKSSYWLTVIKLFSNYKMSTEAAETFREVVAGFNSSRSDGTDAQNLAATNSLIADAKRILPGFSLSLLETEESSIVESTSLLKDENARTEINFELLKVMLKKCESLKLELDKIEKAKGKDSKLNNPR